MAILQQRSRQRIRRRLKLDNQKAILGDADGIVKEPGEAGLVRVRYVTAAGFSLPETVRLRTVVPIFPGLPILVGYDDDLKKAVINIDWEGCVSAGIDPFVANPADREVYGFKNQESIITLLSRPTTPPSLSVVVLPFIYRDSSNTWHWFNPSSAVDLTASVPSSGNHLVAGLFLKTDDTIEVKLSTAQNEVDPLGLSDVQECQAGATAGSIPVWFWRLVGGMTEIASEHNFLDGRQLINIGGNAGTVTSVALTMPAEFSVAGSPITSSGTLAVTKANENANTAFAGPTSGSAAAPTFRALVEADIPALAPPSNLIVNASFETWENGISAEPDNWALAGAGATVARNSATPSAKHGHYAAKVTRSGTDCHLTTNGQLRSAGGGNLYIRGRTYTFAAWVYATVASRARLRFNDGVNTSYSSYHSGGSAWEYLSVTVTVDGSGTGLNVGLAIDTGNTSAYIDAAVLVEGTRTPQGFQPELHLFNGFPHRAQIFAHDMIITAGTPSFSRGVTTSQPFNMVWIDTAASANDGDAFTFSVWLRDTQIPGLTTTIAVLGTQATSRGKLDWYLDEELIQSGQDWYAAVNTFDVLQTISSVTVRGNGYHVLKGVVNGKNASSTDFVISLTEISIYQGAD